MSRKEITTERSSRSEIEAFRQRMATAPALKPAGTRGRLLFAMDATASREPTWDRACHLQARMFEVTAELGGLNVQLAWFRGHGEFRTSRWQQDAAGLAAQMTDVRCRGGLTQIEKVLQHALAEHGRQRLQALVFVGDCMEEPAANLERLAGQLGLKGIKAFLFQEGEDPVAEHTFRSMARLTGGAWCRFDTASADQLRELLQAVAVYAAGGYRALERYSRQTGSLAQQIHGQLEKPR